MELVWYILIGAAAGWLAGRITRGSGFGLVRNVIVGVLGGVLGGWMFGMLGLSAIAELGGSLVTAVVGAVVLLYLISLIKRKW
jgi:uncharacterized membrane protein YeaQ/YmgE (transglycosylase-associated protein family)